ncbi:hypothetical protein C2W62_04350, partial [Candidatus Entotheonella serta]
VAVITIAFCWAYHVGAWLNEIKAIRIKKHQRPAKSVFRYGFDWLRHLYIQPSRQIGGVETGFKIIGKCYYRA